MLKQEQNFKIKMYFVTEITFLKLADMCMRVFLCIYKNF